jgi:hypothetical protein
LTTIKQIDENKTEISLTDSRKGIKKKEKPEEENERKF